MELVHEASASHRRFGTGPWLSREAFVVLSDVAETRLSGEHIRIQLMSLQNFEPSLNNLPWNLQVQASHQDLKSQGPG